MPEDLEDEYSPEESLLVISSVIEAIDAWLDSLDRHQSQAKAVGALEGMLEGSRDVAAFRDCIETLRTESLVVAHAASLLFLCQIEPDGLRQDCVNASFATFASKAKCRGNGDLALFLQSFAELNTRGFNPTASDSLLMEQICACRARELANFFEGCDETACMCRTTDQEGWMGIAEFFLISCQEVVDYLASALEEYIL